LDSSRYRKIAILNGFSDAINAVDVFEEVAAEAVH